MFCVEVKFTKYSCFCQENYQQKFQR
ncbi:hypothetical protein J4G02_00035 [Candidatus Poribacteria bacterium]|nr:hypothetical protein [Candidatus Poribacteria bacterium]